MQLEPCVWHQCIDPVTPPGKGLKHDWDENPVEFGDTITYSCARDNLWFEHDKDFVSFEVKCMEDGFFEDKDDDDWLNCVSSNA